MLGESQRKEENVLHFFQSKLTAIQSRGLLHCIMYRCCMQLGTILHVNI